MFGYLWVPLQPASIIKTFFFSFHLIFISTLTVIHHTHPHECYHPLRDRGRELPVVRHGQSLQVPDDSASHHLGPWLQHAQLQDGEGGLEQFVWPELSGIPLSCNTETLLCILEQIIWNWLRIRMWPPLENAIIQFLSNLRDNKTHSVLTYCQRGMRTRN